MEHSKDEALEQWVNNLEGDYKYRCQKAFLKFIEFLKDSQNWKEASGDTILAKHLENRKSDDKKIKYYFDDLIPSFIAWYKNKGPSHNFIVVQAGMVQSFFKYHREPLQIQSKRMRRIEVKKRYHAYTRDELVRMVQVGNLEEKAIIMLGVQLGIRVGDFISLKRHPIIEAYKDSNGVFPLEFEIETKKEGVISIGHISKDVYQTLQLLWASKPKSEYVFPSDGGRFFISEDKANDVIKNCWLKAYPDRKDVKVRFHELRSYKISALTNLGVNTWIIMKMTGKKVSPDINSYLTGINFKEMFNKAEQALTVIQITNSNHAAIGELKEELKTLRDELGELRNQIKTQLAKKEN
jgi:integrase